ncbi:hypothetical protein PROFUN_11267 [Planoprotostelium fungivorum]|uniref:Uncharacterized protein n=1 Tax=Planoprotostelium fungivorum TaxID=1890364 RepID=A0A2P6NAF0_9EUKA|nr:hypothetical protein PROFUN_11267 [Planoprotostelium fungivorum]
MMKDLMHVDEKGSLKLGSDLTSMARARIQSCKREQSKELNLKEVELPRIPQRLGKLKTVTELNLERNRIKVIDEKPILELAHIQVLNLSYNEISILPNCLNRLTGLVNLNVAGNNLMEFPHSLAFPRLHTLDISRNKVKEISNTYSETLTNLNWAASELASVPSVLFSFKKLRILDISLNKFTTLPEDFGNKLSLLENLDLNGNSLTSTSLPTLGQLTRLKTLNLAENKLTDLPPAFFTLTIVEKLDLKANSITAIPDDIYKLEALEELNLLRNQLTGLPTSIGKLKKMRIFIASENQIKVMPHELGHLYETLRKVVFTNNKISEVPGEFGWINPSIEFNLDGNPLKPPFIQWMQDGPLEFLSNLKPYTQAWPATTIAEGEFRDYGPVAQGKSFTIKGMDYKGGPRTTGGENFKVKCYNKSTGVQAELILKDLKDGTYSVFYNFRQAGEYEVSVTLRNEEIKNSPWTLVIQ